MGRIPDGQGDGVIALIPPGDNPIRRCVDVLHCPVVDLDNHTPSDGRHRVLAGVELPGAAAKQPKGFLAPQVHEIMNDRPAEVRWRNLRIREFKPDSEARGKSATAPL